MEEAVRVVPADATPWEDVRAVFGARGETARCLCQRMRCPHRMWHEMPVGEREVRLRAQAAGGGGLVAYHGEEPVGWCAVGPRPGFLRRGVMRALAAAAVGFACERGARAIEGYPMVREVGKDVTWGEMRVGAESAFRAAGFEVVSRPVPRRVVMRVEFARE